MRRTLAPPVVLVLVPGLVPCLPGQPSGASAVDRQVDPAWVRGNLHTPLAVAVGDSGIVAVVGYRLAKVDDAVRESVVLRVFDVDGARLWTRCRTATTDA